MDLTQHIHEPITGYVSSPAHSARYIAALVEERFGARPRSIHSSRGYSFRLVFADGSKHTAHLQFEGAAYGGGIAAVHFDLKAQQTTDLEQGRDTMATSPAIVQGRGRYAQSANVIALFIEDESGDLVDIEFLCSTCAYARPEAEGALSLPAFDWSTDSASYCRECRVCVNAITR